MSSRRHLDRAKLKGLALLSLDSRKNTDIPVLSQFHPSFGAFSVCLFACLLWRRWAKNVINQHKPETGFRISGCDLSIFDPFFLFLTIASSLGFMFFFPECNVPFLVLSFSGNTGMSFSVDRPFYSSGLRQCPSLWRVNVRLRSDTNLLSFLM